MERSSARIFQDAPTIAGRLIKRLERVSLGRSSRVSKRIPKNPWRREGEGKRKRRERREKRNKRKRKKKERYKFD